MRGKTRVLAPQVSDPPNQLPPKISRPLRDTQVHTRFTKAGVLSLLILIGLLLLLLSGQLFLNLLQPNNSKVRHVAATTHPNATPKSNTSSKLTPTPTQDFNATTSTLSPVFTPNNATLSPLQLPDGYYVIYEQKSNLYMVSSTGNFSSIIPTQGYIYSEAVPPVLTPSGQLLYTGDGLWSLDLTQSPATLQPILDENPQQGPLALTPNGNGLLYSSTEGAVPVPTDNSVPTDVAALSYANDLNLTILSKSLLTLGASQVILPEQDNLSNTAQYHWVTTPVFSPDAHTLAYVEFSIDSQDPYDRHSALYTVQIIGSGAHLHPGKPNLIATSHHLLM